MSTGRPMRATAVLLASLTAVFGVALASPAAAQPSPTTSPSDPAEVAAGWLAGQLVDGNHFEVDLGGGQVFADHGLTADAVLAFDAADVAQDSAVAATTWLGLDDNVSAYAGNGSTDSYVGSLAKLALVATSQGANPHSFGEGKVDLIDRLAARQNADTGRFSDLSSFPPPNDFSNGITQSLAIIALVRVPGRDTAAEKAIDLDKAVDFLVDSRCDDGGFPLQFDAQPCTSEADVTAFAVQALLAADRDDEAAGALDYLEAVQDETTGGFGGSGPTAGLNANSTGLAAQALRVGGRDAAADAAVKYLLGLQVGCAGPAEQRGGVAYDTVNGFEASTAVRATAQALYGLTGVGLLTVDNEGDAAGAPTLTCTPPTTTTPPAPAPQPPAQGSSGGSDLPATGVQPAAGIGLGVLLVLAGAAALLVSRRRPGLSSGGERP